VIINLDKDSNHEAAVVEMQKIQNLNKDSALFVVNFNDQFLDTINNRTTKDHKRYKFNCII
jgi:hypothetical protein